MPTKKEKTNRSIELSPEDGGSSTLSPAKAWFLGIGIDDYEEFPKLNNAVKDVEDVMKILVNKYDLDEENAFLLTNKEATEDNIIERLDFFSKKLNKADKLMIYYSGHGHLDRNTNLGFWIPQDAVQGKTSRYIRNSTIRDYLNVINTRHTLLISDSCFSGSLFVRGASRATNSAIEELEALESRWAICSGRADEEVNDGPPGGNSPFAESIIDTLNRNQDKFLNIAKIADKVILQTRSNYEQLPEGNPLYGVGHKGGQYIFRLKANEKEAWAVCQAEGTLAAYQTFLTNYPDGKNAEEAKEELTFLKEEKVWATAKAKNTITAYTEYDQQFPKGRYSRQSLEAIKDLEDHQHWKKALRQNTITSYKEYLLGHPNGLHVKEAEANLEAILQGKTTTKSVEAIIEKAATVSSKETPISTKSAEEEAWEETNKVNTKEAYDQFYLRFPHGKFRNEVREALRRFEQPKKVNTQSTVPPKPIPREKSNSVQSKKIALGTSIAVVLALLIWGMMSFFGGKEEPGGTTQELSKLSVEKIKALIVKEGFKIEDLKLALNETQLSIFGVVTSEEVYHDVDYFIHDMDDLPVSDINNKIRVETESTLIEEEPTNDENEGSAESDKKEEEKASPSVPVKIQITEKSDRLLVKIAEGTPPYNLSLLKDQEERYSKEIDIAGVYTIKLKEHQKDPGIYTVLVEDERGKEVQESIVVKELEIPVPSTPLLVDPNAIGGKEELDQSQKISSGTFGSPDRWQSFTAGQTGYLTKVSAYHYSTKQVGKLYIYEGEGKSGQLLHSQAVEADGTKLLYFPLTKGIWLEKGKKYTLRFDKFAWFVSKENSYAGGRADFNARLDFYFETYVNSGPIDQSQKVSGGTYGAYSRWQSFTAGQNGYLTKIAVYHYAGHQKTKLNIFEGEGKNGKLLHSQPVEADGTKIVNFPLTKGVKIEKGKKYTINFEKFAWFVSKGDAYSGGRADFNAGLDFYFETYVIPIKN